MKWLLPHVWLLGFIPLAIVIDNLHGSYRALAVGAIVGIMVLVGRRWSA